MEKKKAARKLDCRNGRLPPLKEETRDGVNSQVLDEAVDGWIEMSKRGQLIRGTSRDHEVSLGIELVSPQAGCSERFFSESDSQVVTESA